MVQSDINLRHLISDWTNFRGREGQNILPGFIFTSVPKNHISRVLIFAEYPKVHKITKFFKRENLVP